MDRNERAVLASAECGIIAADEQGRIAYVNDEAIAAMGRPVDVGQSLSTLMPERLRPRHEEGFRRYVDTGESRLAGRTVRVPVLTEDGSEQEIDLTIRIFSRPDGTRLAVASVVPAEMGRPPTDLLRIESAFEARAYELV